MHIGDQLFFKINQHWFGLEHVHIVQVALNQTPAWFPKYDHKTAGLALIDGEQIPVLDTGSLIEDLAETDDTVHLVILQSDKQSLAVPCHQIRTNLTLEEIDLDAYLKLSSEKQADHYAYLTIDTLIDQ
jgi:chemotaxis signal transduction protein